MDPKARPDQILATAANELLEVLAELSAENRSVVLDVIGAAPFTRWEHYPASDCHDSATGALFFYHAHEPDQRSAEEHGHFHCFVERIRLTTGAVPILSPSKRRTAKELCHLAALSIDRRGVPSALFTTNQWVTDEWLYPAGTVTSLLDCFTFPSFGATALTARWLSAIMALFRPQIARLLAERDAVLAIDRSGIARRARARALEVTSRAAIDLDEQIAVVLRSSSKQHTEAAVKTPDSDRCGQPASGWNSQIV